MSSQRADLVIALLATSLWVVVAMSMFVVARPRREPRPARAVKAGQASDLGRLLEAYDDVLCLVDRLPPVVFLPYSRTFLGRRLKVPRLGWRRLLRYFVVLHITRTLDTVSRKLATGAVLSDEPQGYERALGRIDGFRRCLPSVPVRRLVVTLLLAVALVGYLMVPVLLNRQEEQLALTIVKNVPLTFDVNTIPERIDHIAKAVRVAGGEQPSSQQGLPSPEHALRSLQAVLAVLLVLWLAFYLVTWLRQDRAQAKREVGPRRRPRPRKRIHCGSGSFPLLERRRGEEVVDRSEGLSAESPGQEGEAHAARGDPGSRMSEAGLDNGAGDRTSSEHGTGKGVVACRGEAGAKTSEQRGCLGQIAGGQPPQAPSGPSLHARKGRDSRQIPQGVAQEGACSPDDGRRGEGADPGLHTAQVHRPPSDDQVSDDQVSGNQASGNQASGDRADRSGTAWSDCGLLPYDDRRPRGEVRNGAIDNEVEGAGMYIRSDESDEAGGEVEVAGTSERRQYGALRSWPEGIEGALPRMDGSHISHISHIGGWSDSSRARRASWKQRRGARAMPAPIWPWPVVAWRMPVLTAGVIWVSTTLRRSTPTGVPRKPR
jgi:hypothetical protein